MLTKQAINRLKESELEVKLINGCYNEVRAVAKYSGGRKYELRVQVTHPSLTWACGDKNSVELIEWNGCRGLHLDIPKELNSLVDKMKGLGKMCDIEATEHSKGLVETLMDSYKEMGCV